MKRVVFLFVGLLIVVTFGCGRSNFVADGPEGQQISLGIQPEDPAEVVTAEEPVVIGSEIGERAPDFALRDFDDAVVKLSDFRGRPVVIDFWAAWCPFCIEELPELEKAYQTHKEQGLMVLGVHRTETELPSVGGKFARDRLNTTFPLLRDERGEIFQELAGGRPFMPVSLFLNREGVIVHKQLGPKTPEQIQTFLADIL